MYQIPNVEVPMSKDKILKQIQALEWVLEKDTNQRDKEIHTIALQKLKMALRLSK